MVETFQGVFSWSLKLLCINFCFHSEWIAFHQKFTLILGGSWLSQGRSATSTPPPAKISAGRGWQRCHLMVGWLDWLNDTAVCESKALNSSGDFHKWECPNGWVVYDDCGYPYDLGHLQVGFLWNHCCNADVSCFLYCPYQHYWVYNPCRAQVEIWTTRHGTNRIGRWMRSQFSGRGQASPWMCQIHTVWFWLINRLTSLNEQPEYEWRDSWPSRPLHFFTEGVCSAKVWQAVTDGSHPSVSGFLALGQCKYNVSNQFEVQERERERDAEDDWSCSLPNHDSNHRADTGSVDRNPLAHKRLVVAFNGYFRTIEIYKDWFQTCVVVSSSALLGTRYSSDWWSWGGSQCCNLGPRVMRFCIYIYICVCVRVFFNLFIGYLYVYTYICICPILIEVSIHRFQWIQVRVRSQRTEPLKVTSKSCSEVTSGELAKTSLQPSSPHTVGHIYIYTLYFLHIYIYIQGLESKGRQ